MCFFIETGIVIDREKNPMVRERTSRCLERWASQREREVGQGRVVIVVVDEYILALIHVAKAVGCFLG